MKNKAFYFLYGTALFQMFVTALVDSTMAVQSVFPVIILIVYRAYTNDVIQPKENPLYD